jgi:hypothetical protein
VTWRFAATSVAGTSHVAVGTGCQDAHKCEVFLDGADGETLIVVVSDGAGSAKFGATGSEITTGRLLELAASWLREGNKVRSLDAKTVLDWLDGVRDNISHEASANGHQMRDYAATLLLAMMNERASAFAQIGDGAIVTSDEAGEWEAEFWPQRGVYANQTFFVTDETAHEHLRFAQGIRSNREVAVFSDGLERVLLNHSEHRAHSPVFDKMLQPLRTARGDGHVSQLSEALARYMQSEPITSRTDDDVTLVIASRLPSA